MARGSAGANVLGVDVGAVSVSAAEIGPDGALRRTFYRNQLCLITAARRFHPHARSILVVGGERFGLVRFDAEGPYLSYRANPLSAAGTGGFVDQRARRLNLGAPPSRPRWR